MKFNLRRKKSWIYTSIMSFLLVGFALLISSKLYMSEKEVYFHNKLKEEIKITSSSSLRIEKRNFNKKKNEMEVYLRFSDAEENYDFRAIEKANSNSDLPLKVVYQDQGNYVLYIRGLSPEWKALAIDVLEKETDLEAIDSDDEENEESYSIVKTIYSDQSKTPIDNSVSVKKENMYAIDFVNVEREVVNKEIDEIEKSMEEEKINQQILRDEIEKLKEESKYQTDIEKVETQSNIKSKVDQIRRGDVSIEELKFEYETAQDKLTKLQLKEQDLLVLKK